MVELTVLDARCYVCGHLISGPITLHTDKGQAHPSCVNCSPYAEARADAKAALNAAGFRILGPDEVDPVTLEKAAAAIHDEWVAQKGLNCTHVCAVVRALGRKA